MDSVKKKVTSQNKRSYTKFSVDWDPYTEVDDAYANIGLNNLAEDWSGYNTFSLKVMNTNETDWFFTLYAILDGATYSSTTYNVVKNGSKILSVDLSPSLPNWRIDSHKERI
jgi:hypothetical protein